LPPVGMLSRAGSTCRVTDVATTPHPTKHRQRSPRIAENDRKILLEILESDELDALFQTIATEDFGADAPQLVNRLRVCDQYIEIRANAGNLPEALRGGRLAVGPIEVVSSLAGVWHRRRGQEPRGGRPTRCQFNSSCLELSGCQLVIPFSGKASGKSSRLDCDLARQCPERVRPGGNSA